jgi:prolyl-tRNA editing enzyme YbaK/EbsC (Cys-tRNA(Pro) deacylase)
MTLPQIGTFEIVPALEHLELVAQPVAAALQAWDDADPRVRTAVGVTAIDPAYSDTAALVEKFALRWDSSANCVLVAGKRQGTERVAAALVRADTRADVNGTIRRLLDVRKASFMPTDQAVAASGMEYGGITPVGVPQDWRILIDARLTSDDPVLIGAGVRSAKLAVPGELFRSLPRVELIPDLGR